MSHKKMAGRDYAPWIIIDRVAGQIIRLVVSVCPSVRPFIRLSVCALLLEPFDLWPSFLAWRSTLTLARLGLQVKVIGQSSRSHGNKLCFCHVSCQEHPKIVTLYVWQRPSNRTGAEWSVLVLGFVKYSKRSSETPVSYTPKNHHRVFISRSIQNGGTFKMVLVPTGCAIAVDHAFNFLGTRGHKICRYTLEMMAWIMSH